MSTKTPLQDAPAELRTVARSLLDTAVAEVEQEPFRATIHQARKRCKRLRGLLRLFRDALGDTYAAENAFLRDTARRLSDLRDATARVETAEALADSLSGELWPLWERLRAALARRRDAMAGGAEAEAFTEKPGQLIDRFEAYARVGSRDLDRELALAFRAGGGAS